MLFHNDITMYEEFAGGGGTTQAATKVSFVRLIAAANHDEHAIAMHEKYFPEAEHFQEDISKLPVEKMPYATIFGGSPVCPPFSNAKGIARDFDKKNAQLALIADPKDETPEAIAKRKKYARGRMLMQEPIRYLRAMIERHGKPVLGGVIENVIEARKWAEWDRWIAEFRQMGYYVKVIAYNSMFAIAPNSRRAPQSRDRLYVVFWHKSLGRDPDFDKWLRPEAFCPNCDTTVNAMQAWKQPGQDMGRYGKNGQYVYRCPSYTCRNTEVFPSTVPALAAINPNIPGVRIGDREALGMPALVENTLARIRAGIRKFWAPLLVPVGGTWRKDARPLDAHFPTLTTRETDGVAVPAFTLPPFITPMRGGGDAGRARSVFDPAHTFTAGGNHHGLAMPPLVIRNYTARPGSPAAGRVSPASEEFRTLTAAGNQSLIWRSQLLVPYYSGSTSAVPAARPIGTLTTKDTFGLLTPADLDMLAGEINLDDVLFRMLDPEEAALAMGWDADYLPLGPSREVKMSLVGNACTPPVMELLYSALVECISGVELSRDRVALAA